MIYLTTLQKVSYSEFLKFLDSPKSPMDRKTYEKFEGILRDKENLIESISFIKSFFKKKYKKEFILFPWAGKKLRAIISKERRFYFEEILLNCNLNEKMKKITTEKKPHPLISFKIKQNLKREHKRMYDKKLNLKNKVFFSKLFSSAKFGEPLGILGFVLDEKKEYTSEHYLIEIVKRAFRGKIMDQIQNTFDYNTGTYSKNHFENIYEKICLDAGINGTKIAYFICDVNLLKMYNDYSGYDAGDELLEETGRILTDSFSSRDVVARTGGDEFKIIAPSLTEKNLKVKKELIEQMCEETKLKKVKVSAMKKGRKLKKEIRFNRPYLAIGHIIIKPGKCSQKVMRKAESQMREEKNKFKKEYGFISRI